MSLGKLATIFMRSGRFDDVASVLSELVATEYGATYGPPHPRRIAACWSEIADVVAAGDRTLLGVYLSEAELRFASHVAVVPQMLELVDDLPGARAALERRLDRNPADLEARESLVRVLIRSDLIDEAECEIETRLIGASDVETVDCLRGRAAMRKQDWDAAHAAWTRYWQRRPDDHAAGHLLDRLNLVRQLSEAEETNNPAPPFPIAPQLRNDPETRDLLLRFESIGTTCDFGSVQRRYGAEPLGLLRWANTDLPSLMIALAAGFDGFGDPENTELIVVGELRHIYLKDQRWGLPLNTFLLEPEVSVAALYPKMCRRTAYLRDKFLDDLRAAAKTIVFKSDLAERSELVELHDALRAFGPIRLLNVRSADLHLGFPAQEPCSVEEIRPDLFVGRVSRTFADDVPFEEWVEICKHVERKIESESRPMSQFAA